MGEEEEGYLESLKKRIFALSPDEHMATEIINFIYVQLNEVSRKGAINFSEYRILVMEAELALLKLLFIKNFTRKLTDREILAEAGSTLMCLLFTRVLDGRDRELALAEIQAKQNLHIHHPT